MSSLVVTLAAETLRMSVPYAMAAAGGVISEKSGIANITLEGVLLSSAFGAIAMTLATNHPLAGLAFGIAVGAFLGFLHGILTAKYKVDAIVSGVAINLAAAGGTRLLLRALFASSSNSPPAPPLVSFEASSLGVFGALVRTILDPIFLLSLACIFVVHRVLFRTRFGLDLRAAGEDPTAARTVGVDVVRTRVLAVTVGGAVCALGGVALSFGQHQFQSGMSGGRGFIALAAVIVSRWRPLVAVVFCLAFALLDALSAVLQSTTHLPPDVLSALPYIATLASLCIARKNGSGAPSGMGKFAS